jgi:hypothetical protein
MNEATKFADSRIDVMRIECERGRGEGAHFDLEWEVVGVDVLALAVARRSVVARKEAANHFV